MRLGRRDFDDGARRAGRASRTGAWREKGKARSCRIRMRIGRGRRIRFQRIEHRVAEESPRLSRGCLQDRSFVARRRSRSTRRARRRARRVPPPSALRVRADRPPAIPFGGLRHILHAFSGTARRANRKSAAKRSAHARRKPPDHPTGFASGLFQLVMPAASASCVRPATLLTPSFFIMVLR